MLPSVSHRKRIVQMLNNYHDNHLHPTRVWKCIPDIWHLVPMALLSICIITFLPNFHASVWKKNEAEYFALWCGLNRYRYQNIHNSAERIIIVINWSIYRSATVNILLTFNVKIHILKLSTAVGEKMSNIFWVQLLLNKEFYWSSFLIVTYRTALGYEHLIGCWSLR